MNVQNALLTCIYQDNYYTLRDFSLPPTSSENLVVEITDWNTSVLPWEVHLQVQDQPSFFLLQLSAT